MFTFLLRVHTVPPIMISAHSHLSTGRRWWPRFSPSRLRLSPLPSLSVRPRTARVDARTQTSLYTAGTAAALLFNQTYFKKYALFVNRKYLARTTHASQMPRVSQLSPHDTLPYKVVCNTMLTPRACRSELPVSTVAVTRHWKRWNWAACTTFSP